VPRYYIYLLDKGRQDRPVPRDSGPGQTLIPSQTEILNP
jgi:hypothetical protein